MGSDFVVIGTRREAAECQCADSCRKAAERWSETSADIIREARFEPDDLRALVAPVDGPTKGDAAIVGISLAVIIWIAFDALRVLL